MLCPDSVDLDRKCVYAALSLSIFALSLYLYCMPSGFPPGHDSAELITAAAVSGVAHPPGYPLYTLTSSLAMQLFPGEPPFIANVWACVCGAAAVGFACLAFCLSTGKWWAGLLGASTLMAARTPWRMAIGAEVFSMHLAICAALLFCATMWRAGAVRSRHKWLSAAALVLGLGLAHHHTVVLVLPGLALFGYVVGRREEWGWRWSQLGLVAVGLVPYLWLPWRASSGASLNWGNPSNLKRFLWVVTRSGYGSMQLSTASGATASQGFHLAHYFRSLVVEQFPGPGALVGLFGACTAGLARRADLGLYGVLFLLAGPVWALIAAQPAGDGYVDMLERFYATSYLGFAGLVSLGFGQIGDLVQRRMANRPRLVLALLCVSVVVILATLGYNYSACSERGQEIVSNSLACITGGLPEGALVITTSDATSGLLMYATLQQHHQYLHVPAGLASSAWFVETMPQRYQQALKLGGLETLMQLARVEGRPVYSDWVVPQVKGFFVQEGLMFRYLRPGEPIPERAGAALKSWGLLEGIERQGDYQVSKDRPFWSNFYVQRWQQAYREVAQGLVQVAPEVSAKAAQIAASMEAAQ